MTKEASLDPGVGGPKISKMLLRILRALSALSLPILRLTSYFLPFSLCMNTRVTLSECYPRSIMVTKDLSPVAKA